MKQAFVEVPAAPIASWDQMTVGDLYIGIRDVQREINEILQKFTRETGVLLKVSAHNFKDYELCESTGEHHVVAEGYAVRAKITNL